MIKFRTGDVVVAVTHFTHTRESSKSFREGDEFIVEHCTASAVTFKNRGNFTYSPSSFELVYSPREQNTANYHPHHDVIVAWAKGAKIEAWLPSAGVWKEIDQPGWFKVYKYRIKPKKTVKELEIERVESEMRKLADDLNKLKGV